LAPNFYFWQKTPVFDQNFYLSIKKFRFLTKILTFDQISIFGQNFYFWLKFLFLTKISIFGQNLEFLTNKNLFFLPKFRFWTKCCGKNSILDQKYIFIFELFRATKIRDQTIGVEYKRKNRKNIFVDGRINAKSTKIGENDEFEVEKFAMAAKKNMEKSRNFNVGNDDEENLVLTHRGKSLADMGKWSQNLDFL